MKDRRRSISEVFIVIAVVVLTIVLAVGLYRGRVRVYKSQQLIQELSALRAAVLLYSTMNHRPPPSLMTLVREQYRFDGQVQKPYLESPPAEEGGKLIDPFGHVYTYHPETGWVSTTTPGFESW